MPEFELVLPCYNEAKTLGRLLQEVIRAAKEAHYDPSRFQLVLVQNGSTDNTAEEARRLHQQFGEWFRIKDIKVNQGYGFGIWSGLQETTAPFVGWSHADLQCSPADAFRALAVLKAEKKTIVRGRRRDRDIKDRFVSRVFEFLSRMILGMRCFEINAQPKVFSREFLKEIKNPPTHFGFDLYSLFRAKCAGYQEQFIDVSFPPRIHGTSKWAGTLWQRHRTILGMIGFMWRLRRTEGRVT